MKRIVTFFLSVILTLSSTLIFANAQGEDTLSTDVKSAVLMDVATGKVLYAKNENEKLYPASVTKIMPLLIFMEAIDSGKLSLDEVVTTSPNAASKGGSQIWLKDGEQMTVDELLRAIAVASANDACTALGEHVAGSEEAFVAMLNERAKELSMNDTHFDNCTGLDDDTTTHLTTAHDVAIMSRQLLTHDRIKSYTTIWMDELRGGATQLVNTNKLVRFYEGTTGLKTGTTTKAGSCLSASAEKNGLHLISVVLGAKNTDTRFESAKKMLDWGFANFESFTPSFDESLLTELKVINGIEERVMPQIEQIKALTLEKGKGNQIQPEILLATDVQAPVEKDQVLGTVKFKVGDEVISEYNLISPIKIEKTTFFDMVMFFFRCLSIREL